jgi:hypothetical protein
MMITSHLSVLRGSQERAKFAFYILNILFYNRSGECLLRGTI